MKAILELMKQYAERHEIPPYFLLLQMDIDGTGEIGRIDDWPNAVTILTFGNLSDLETKLKQS